MSNIVVPETTEAPAFKSAHFIGIGGAGMSGIALVLHERGYAVSGIARDRIDREHHSQSRIRYREQPAASNADSARRPLRRDHRFAGYAG